MIFKIMYNKNLKMNPGKLASQVAHVACELSLLVGDKPDKVIVLECRESKLKSLSANDAVVYQYDLGYTEVESGTLTAVGWVE